MALRLSRGAAVIGLAAEDRQHDGRDRRRIDVRWRRASGGIGRRACGPARRGWRSPALSDNRPASGRIPAARLRLFRPARDHQIRQRQIGLEPARRHVECRPRYAEPPVPAATAIAARRETPDRRSGDWDRRTTSNDKPSGDEDHVTPGATLGDAVRDDLSEALVSDRLAWHDESSSHRDDKKAGKFQQHLAVDARLVGAGDLFAYRRRQISRDPRRRAARGTAAAKSL